jgi:hypothetical protein
MMQNWTHQQRLAYRNIRLKQHLFDLTLHPGLDDSVQMPNARYLNSFADHINYFIAAVPKESGVFRRGLLTIRPGLSEAQISIAKEVILFRLPNFIIGFEELHCVQLRWVPILTHEPCSTWLSDRTVSIKRRREGDAGSGRHLCAEANSEELN